MENKERKLSKCSPKSSQLFQNRDTTNNISSDNKKEIMELFNIKDESLIPYEISYLLFLNICWYHFKKSLSVLKNPSLDGGS